MNSFINKLRGKKEPEDKDHEVYFPDFESARKLISDASYEDPELCKMIAAKTRIYQEKLNTSPYDLNAPQSFLLSVIQKILLEKKESALNIVDLGGACGAHYFEIKRLIPARIKLNWFIIETEEMVRAAHEIEKANEGLYFRSDLKQLDIKPHLIHSSSTLQYIGKPYSMIEQLKSMETEYLFFNRMMFNLSETDLITIQQSQMADNGPGPMPAGFQNKLIRYPHTNLSYKRFMNAFLPQYQAEWIFDEPSGNISKGKLDIVGKGMMFMKV